MSWLISGPRTEWKLDPNVFIALLREQWPNAEIRETKEGNFSHEWKIAMPERSLEGSFNQHYSGVVLDYDIHYAAPFAVWFRKLVPETQMLQFYDEGYNAHIELGPNTTEAEIIKGVGY